MQCWWKIVLMIGCIGLESSSHDADLVKLYLATIQLFENLFRDCGDLVVDAESARDLAGPVIGNAAKFLCAHSVEEPGMRWQKACGAQLFSRAAGMTFDIALIESLRETPGVMTRVGGEQRKEQGGGKVARHSVKKIQLIWVKS
jgi:hypothetical protein